MTRNVTIERDGRYWLVYVDGTKGLTQARNYGEVALMAREYVALTEDVPVDEVQIGTITVRGVSDRLAEAHVRCRGLSCASDARFTIPSYCDTQDG